MNRKNITAFFRGFLAVMLAIVLMLAYYLIRRLHRNAASSRDAAQTDVSQTVPAALTGRTDILFVCTDGGAVTLALYADFYLDAQRVSVYALPLDGGYPYEGALTSMADIYDRGGAPALVAAAGARLGLAFSRGVVCTSEQFAAVTELLGETEITAQDAVSYAYADAVIELQPGKHSLSGTSLYYYLLYGAQGDRLYALQTDVFARMLDAYIVPSNVEKGESLFAKLVNAVDSDITAYDYAAYADVVAAMAASDALVYEGQGLAALPEGDG